MRSKIKSRIRLYFLLFLGFLLILLFLFHRPIFIAAGKFLSPEGSGIADAVILEGCDLAREKGIEVGLRLLAAKRAYLMIIVEHDSGSKSTFGQILDYDTSLIKNLEVLGLKKGQIQVMTVPNNHPVTLTEAQIVLTYLHNNNVKRAFLLAEGFHTRRSYLTYKKIALPLNIEIIPIPYFLTYGKHAYTIEDWWKKTDGIYSFVMEWFKFIYYILRGYIPVKNLLIT